MSSYDVVQLYAVNVRKGGFLPRGLSFRLRLRLRLRLWLGRVVRRCLWCGAWLWPRLWLRLGGGTWRSRGRWWRGSRRAADLGFVDGGGGAGEWIADYG